MFIILLVFIFLVILVCAVLYFFSSHKAHEDTRSIEALKVIQQIDDPLQRQVAINDWMHRNV